MRAAWLWLALSLFSAADAKPERKVPDRDRQAEVKRREEAKKRAERERAIEDCMADRDGDPDADREACEDEVGEP